MKLKLKYPIAAGRKTIEELSFRDHTTAADYLAFDVRGGVAQNIALIANLTGTDEALIRQLRGQDYRAATRIADKMMLSDDEEQAGGEADPQKKPSES
ncbi:MAG: phage tail assembly protein [Proteobacteria bacterium]|nr:phage tail assembly protein [Pseudomonadota bacterium]